jgi:hypothetical protein
MKNDFLIASSAYIVMSLEKSKQFRVKSLFYKYHLFNTLCPAPLVREGATQKQDRNFQTATFRQEVISGRKSQSGLDTKTY